MITGHRTEDIQPSTVGPPLPGVEIRISLDGEILVRSPYFFSTYHKNPEAYEETVQNGWWYSGDAGIIDEQGHLVYMDRVKELAQLGSGEKYAPQYIESGLRFSPYIKDTITIGEGREFVTAIINMDYENVSRWAERNHVPYTTFTDLSQKAEVSELVRQDIDRVNRQLRPTTRLRKYVLLHKEFDPDEADLTRTRKLRRTAMEKRYSDVIEAMYGGKRNIPVVSEFTYEDGRKGTVSADLVIYSVEEERDRNVKGQ
jgi:long-chain acyl-CoA synthetase